MDVSGPGRPSGTADEEVCFDLPTQVRVHAVLREGRHRRSEEFSLSSEHRRSEELLRRTRAAQALRSELEASVDGMIDWRNEERRRRQGLHEWCQQTDPNTKWETSRAKAREPHHATPRLPSLAAQVATSDRSRVEALRASLKTPALEGTRGRTIDAPKKPPMEQFAAMWNSSTRTMDILQALDTDKSGYLEAREFEAAVCSSGLSIDAAREIFRELDLDASGYIDYRELKKKMRQHSSGSTAPPVEPNADPVPGARASCVPAVRGSEGLSPRIAMLTEQRELLRKQCCHFKQRYDAIGILPRESNRARAISRALVEWQRCRVELEREAVARSLAEKESTRVGDTSAVQACLRPSPRASADRQQPAPWRPSARSGGALEPLLDGRGGGRVRVR